MTTVPLLVGFIRGDDGKVRRWEIEPPESVTFEADPGFEAGPLFDGGYWKRRQKRRLVFSFPPDGVMYRVAELREESSPIFDALAATRAADRTDE